MEIEGEEVGARNEDSAVASAGDEGCYIGAAFEKTEGHDRICGEFPFVEEEEANGDNAEDKETDDGRRLPRVVDAAVFETQKKHDGPTDYKEGAKPVDSFQTG